MNDYIGIDLGTTNSAICSFDGESVRLYKSPDQNDVTPSAIFIDRRGNKYIGKRAYDNAARSPENAATLFKRLMGTNTPVNLPAVNLVMTPEQCSSEVLRVLYGYLPEKIRNNTSTGTVITVPAAFNQMQKDATMTSAEAAGVGSVALMQEPVAAVMSVMRQRKSDGVFLVYDLGGGTLDIAIAQSINGRVSLLAHGGIAMCGGRDFDRMLLDNVVRPWLLEHFDLSDDFIVDKQFSALKYMGAWAAEKAKIELSSKEETVITLDDSELRVKDRSGADIYFDITLTQKVFDGLIAQKVAESIASARETMDKAGLSPHDIERVVFVGGPTHYKPLRDRVAFELGIAASTDVNPMTAVAEGAAVFAEAIDWSSQSRGRKSGRGSVTTGGLLDVSFSFVARTPDSKAKLAVKLGGNVVSGAAFQVDSLDTGWSSGRINLKDGAVVEVVLSKPGDNTFKIFIFDATGGPVLLEKDKIIISRTAAQIDAIPASHSICVEARDKLGGCFVPVYLVKEGELLPKKAKLSFRADEALRSGGAGSIKFKLWEGEIEDVVNQNLFIGMFEIKGSDFDDGVIAKGAELLCEYEVLDSGNIILEVTVPSISGSFHSGRNFYSRQEGQIDYTQASKRIIEESETVLKRLEDMSSKIDDERLVHARERLSKAASIKACDTDPESAKQAMDDVQDAKKLIAKTRKDHLPETRKIDLDNCVGYFDKFMRQFARTSEAGSFDNLTKTAQRAIESNSPDFESHLSEMWTKISNVCWRQDWWVIDRFKWYAQATYMFADPQEHTDLVTLGNKALQENNIDELRTILGKLLTIRIGSSGESEMLSGANIVRG